MSDGDIGKSHQEQEGTSDNTGQAFGCLTLLASLGLFGMNIQNLTFVMCLVLLLPALIFLPAIICNTSYNVWHNCFANRPITGVGSLISKTIGTAFLLAAALSVAFDVWIMWDNWHSDFKTFCIIVGGLNLIASVISVMSTMGSFKQRWEPTCMIYIVGYLIFQFVAMVIVYRISV